MKVRRSSVFTNACTSRASDEGWTGIGHLPRTTLVNTVTSVDISDKPGQGGVMSHQAAGGHLGRHHHGDRLSDAETELHPATLAVTVGRPRHGPGAPVSFASGMAAIAAVIEMLPTGGAVVAPSDCYHGVRLLLADLAERNRIETRLVDISDTRATLDRCVGADLLWIESPTNPLMKVADLKVLTKQAHALGVQVAVDNTLATPLLQRPLEQGADLSVHSVTKLLGGHSDLLMGAAVARDQQLADHLRQGRTLRGGTPGLLEAFLALRGLRTLHLRVQHASASAAELARRLERHPHVQRVRYPQLAASGTPGDLPFNGETGGTLLSFEVAGEAQEADAVCAATQLIVHGTSLGGVETLIDRRARWPLEDETPPSLLRLSVGCEYVEDLWRDIDHALAAAVP